MYVFLFIQALEVEKIEVQTTIDSFDDIPMNEGTDVTSPEKLTPVKNRVPNEVFQQDVENILDQENVDEKEEADGDGDGFVNQINAFTPSVTWSEVERNDAFLTPRLPLPGDIIQSESRI